MGITTFRITLFIKEIELVGTIQAVFRAYFAHRQILGLKHSTWIRIWPLGHLISLIWPTEGNRSALKSSGNNENRICMIHSNSEGVASSKSTTKPKYLAIANGKSTEAWKTWVDCVRSSLSFFQSCRVSAGVVGFFLATFFSLFLVFWIFLVLKPDFKGKFASKPHFSQVWKQIHGISGLRPLKISVFSKSNLRPFFLEIFIFSKK